MVTMISKTLPKTWKLFVKHKNYLIPIVILEALFLIALLILQLYFFVPSSEIAIKLGEIITKEAGDLSSSEIYNIDAKLKSNPEFMISYRLLLIYILLFLLGALAAWIILRSGVWFLAHKSAGIKQGFFRYAIKFKLITLFWFIMSAIILFAYSAISGSGETILPLFSPAFATTIIFIIMIVMIYFSQLSFALITQEKT